VAAMLLHHLEGTNQAQAFGALATSE